MRYFTLRVHISPKKQDIYSLAAGGKGCKVTIANICENHKQKVMCKGFLMFSLLLASFRFLWPIVQICCLCYTGRSGFKSRGPKYTVQALGLTGHTFTRLKTGIHASVQFIWYRRFPSFNNLRLKKKDNKCLMNSIG